MQPKTSARSPARRFRTLALAAGALLILALGGLVAAGWPTFMANLHHPWIRQCMAQPVAPSASSFFIPPIHSPDGRFCLSAPSTDVSTRDAPEAGRAFAQAFDLARVEVWDSEAKRNFSLVGHTAPVRCFALSAPFLLTASNHKEDTAVRLWSLESGALLKTLDAHVPACWGGFGFMGFSADRRWIVTATEDHAVHIWDAATGQPAGQVMPDEGPTIFAFAPEQDVLALGGFSGDITLWDWRAGRKLRRWHAHDRFGAAVPDGGGVEALEFLPGGTRLRSHGPVNGVETQREWDAATGRLLPH